MHDIKILILVYTFLGLITAYYANKNRKNPYLWFSLVMLFGIGAIASLTYLIYKTKKRKSMLIQEAISILNQQIKFSDSVLWYYLNNEEKEIGPMSTTKLYSLYKNKTISNSTYVWNQEFETWKLLKETNIYDLFIEKKNAI